MVRCLALCSLSIAISLSSTTSAAALDWPQWRGPQRDGRSTDDNLLAQWPEAGPPRVWSAEGLGSGFSSVAVTNGRIFTMGDFEDGQHVVALSAEDGTPLWRTRVGPNWDNSNLYPGSRSTPTVDGEHLYALGTEGTLACMRTATGELVWERNVQRDFGGFVMMARAGVNWRYAESPLVDGPWVLVTPGAPGAAMVALDKRTGDEVWRAAIPEIGERGDDGAAYSSIVISHGAGVKQYVQLMGRGLVGIRADDGQFLWGYNRIANDVANIATPLVTGDYVFGTTGYGTGAALLQLARDGEGVSANEVYFLEANVLQNHHGGLILHDGFIYTGTGHNQGFPMSARLETGAVAWGPVRNDGRNSAAIAYADDRLYFRYQNGLMMLIEATPDGYQQRGSFQIPNVEEPSWSHPVISGGKLYLREQDYLFCYDVTAS